MKISIITSVFNGKDIIEHAIRSVACQESADIEYIIIDGASTDGTIEVIRKYKDRIAKIVSEPDSGMYEAVNKGIRLASGDVVGILHSDDVYSNKKVLETVSAAFETYNIDSCYSDLQYVHKDNINKVIRHWKSSEYRQGKFRFGWMPPHPTFFVRREIYQKYGYFNTSFRIAADYELMLRFLEKHRISTYYIPEVLIKMRIGGTSNRSLRNLFIKTSEDYKAWKVNNLNGGLHTIFLKNVSKIPQFFRRT